MLLKVGKLATHTGLTVRALHHCVDRAVQMRLDVLGHHLSADDIAAAAGAGASVSPEARRYLQLAAGAGPGAPDA